VLLPRTVGNRLVSVQLWVAIHVNTLKLSI